ncbi:YcbK family protein [Parapusillimonas sp. JC17]|uniref:YcbK family protein n=1 Tax=Parapusillimonas sp. JC17 TaxID=3445768 RepID=UPI003F9FAD35
MTLKTDFARRRFLTSASGAALLGAFPMVSRAISLGSPSARELAMDHTHTREKIELTYAVGSRYVPQAMTDLNHFLRDHYSGLIGSMDPGLYDIMHALRMSLKARAPYQIISGYRSPHTNERLRTTRGGGVARHSLHMDGKAVDLRIPGVPLKELRDAALELKAGGVGYYPGSDFVHVDTGGVRTWRG